LLQFAHPVVDRPAGAAADVATCIADGGGSVEDKNTIWKSSLNIASAPWQDQPAVVLQA
jgi:hypothetical protein